MAEGSDPEVDPAVALDPDSYTIEDMLELAYDYNELNLDSLRGESIEEPGVQYDEAVEWAIRSALIRMMETRGFEFPQSEKALAASKVYDNGLKRDRLLADNRKREEGG
jgi:hypothetical protein